MKTFVDGDQLCIVLDDFTNLQESPALFVPVDDEIGKGIAAMVEEVERLRGEIEQLSALRNELLAEMSVEEVRYDTAIAALSGLFNAGKDALTEIRDRSFARKPLSRALHKAVEVFEA